MPFSLFLIPLHMEWTHLSTLGINSCSGKNSPEYRSVNINRSSITDALKSNPYASKTLKQKFKEKWWLERADDPDDDELVTLILSRIENDVNQFEEFLGMLRNIAGMDQIENILKSKNMHAYLVHAPVVVWEEMSIERRERTVSTNKTIEYLVGSEELYQKKRIHVHVYVYIQKSSSPCELCYAVNNSIPSRVCSWAELVN